MQPNKPFEQTLTTFALLTAGALGPAGNEATIILSTLLKKKTMEELRQAA